MSTDTAAVTHTRHFSGKMSGSRNAKADRPDQCREGTYGWLWAQPSSGDVCYYCRSKFDAGQLRYRIMQGVPTGWGAALLCMECFKTENDVDVLGSDGQGKPATRHTIQCSGCGEYISTIRNPRHQHWNYCSNRCYQRSYRKRRRGQDSVIDWKGRRPNNTCSACKKPIDTYDEPHKRKDAQFCSNKCRQWSE